MPLVHPSVFSFWTLRRSYCVSHIFRPFLRQVVTKNVFEALRSHAALMALVDTASLATHAMDTGKNPECPVKNRRALYHIYNYFSTIKLPAERPDEDDDGMPAEAEDAGDTPDEWRNSLYDYEKCSVIHLCTRRLHDQRGRGVLLKIPPRQRSRPDRKVRQYVFGREFSISTTFCLVIFSFFSVITAVLVIITILVR